MLSTCGLAGSASLRRIVWKIWQWHFPVSVQTKHQTPIVSIYSIYISIRKIETRKAFLLQNTISAIQIAITYFCSLYIYTLSHNNNNCVLYSLVIHFWWRRRVLFFAAAFIAISFTFGWCLFRLTRLWPSFGREPFIYNEYNVTANYGLLCCGMYGCVAMRLIPAICKCGLNGRAKRIRRSTMIWQNAI